LRAFLRWLGRRGRAPHLTGPLLLAGLAEACVVAWRASRIADVGSWARLWTEAFTAGVVGALFFLPGVLLLEIASEGAGRFADRRWGSGARRIAQAVAWAVGGLGAAVWVMSWWERFSVLAVLPVLAAVGVALATFAWLAQTPRRPLRYATGTLALAAVTVGVICDAHTAFGQYPNFHVAAQWLAVLVSVAALREFWPVRSPAPVPRARGLAAAGACAVIFLPLHWAMGSGSAERNLVRGLGWMTLPRMQLSHVASLNPRCEDAAGFPDLPFEARASSFLRYANFNALPRDLKGRNLVLVIMDAVRADRLGAYGSTRRLTPNLDALAEQSVVFKNAYAASSGTTGTMGALFCLSPPSWTEMTTQQVFWRAKLRPGCRTMAERLAARGYRTQAYLQFYVAGTLSPDSGYLRGFQSLTKGKNDAQVVAAALGGLRAAKKKKGPTFAWLQLGQAHQPYTPTPPFVPRDKSEEAHYDAAVQSVDAAVGDLVAGLKKLGLWRRTMLVVMADHGEEFGEHGGRYHNRTLYDEVLRVPLVVHDGRLSPQEVDREVVVSDLSAWLLWEHRGEPDPAVVGRVSESAGRLYGVLGDVRVSELLSNTGVQVSLVRGSEKALRNLSGGYDQLYDLADDPHERRNLAEAEKNDTLLADLDTYEALRRCTRRAEIVPLRGEPKPRAGSVAAVGAPGRNKP
jgi:arylsulfatase A-like enzyme